MLAPNAEHLMRSRYSAYAFNLPHYIIKTTHPHSPHYQKNLSNWSLDIEHFCKVTKFVRLDVQEFIDGVDRAYVIFVAHLMQNGHSFELKERSLFEKVDGAWLYVKDEG